MKQILWQAPPRRTCYKPAGLVSHGTKIVLPVAMRMEQWRARRHLLAEFGLPVAQTAILNFGAQKVLAVEQDSARSRPFLKLAAECSR